MTENDNGYFTKNTICIYICFVAGSLLFTDNKSAENRFHDHIFDSGIGHNSVCAAV